MSRNHEVGESTSPYQFAEPAYVPKKINQELEFSEFKRPHSPVAGSANNKLIKDGTSVSGSINNLDSSLITPEKRLLSTDLRSSINQVRKRARPWSPNQFSESEPATVSTKKKQVAKCLFVHSSQPSTAKTTTATTTTVSNSKSSPSMSLSSGIDCGGGRIQLGLFGGGRRGVSKCLFGAPSEDDNQKLCQRVEEKLQIDYENFQQRYVVESVLDVNY